jgi:hypothetical protein
MVAERLVAAEMDQVDEAALERSIGDARRLRQFCQPLMAVPALKGVLQMPQGAPARRLSRMVMPLHLSANEVAARVALLGEPIGVGEAGQIVVGVLHDGLQKGLLVHRWSVSFIHSFMLPRLGKGDAPVEVLA